VTLYFNSEPRHKIDKNRIDEEDAAKRPPPMVFQTTVRLELASLYSDSTQSSGTDSQQSQQPQQGGQPGQPGQPGGGN